MRKLSLILVLILLVFVLSSCTPAAPPTEPAVPTTEASYATVSPTTQPTEPPTITPKEQLQSFLCELRGVDIHHVEWLLVLEERPSHDVVAEILRTAANKVVSHDAFIDTMDEPQKSSFWTLRIVLGDGMNYDDSLRLAAGLDENIVEIQGGENQSYGSVFVEDEALYNLVRTSMDIPENLEKGIDWTVYHTYQNMIDTHLEDRSLAELGERCGISVRNEMTSCWLALEYERLNAKFYCIGNITYVDPPEKARYLLIGGSYIDSQLRVHGLSSSNILVVIDGEAIGFTSWYTISPEENLEEFSTKDELVEYILNA